MVSRCGSHPSASGVHTGHTRICRGSGGDGVKPPSLEPPPEYWVILCESAVDCLVGGREVMREQLEHLAAMVQRPRITIQVLPNSHGAHPSMTAPFVLLNFDLAPGFSVAYFDYLTGSLYRDEPHEVDQYHRAYRHLIKAALPEDQSFRLITSRMRDLS